MARMSLLAAAVLAAWALRRLWQTVTVAAGYKAKVLCSTIFVSGRDVDVQCADEIAADSYWLLRPLHARADRMAQSVTVSLAGLRTRVAIYRPRLGATLVQHPLPVVAQCEPQLPSPQRRHRAEMPMASRSASLEHVLDAAFEEPDPKRLRRTRAIVVVHDGRIVAERYAAGFSSETPLPGWSMTKSVLGALIGILVGEGRLHLDDRQLLPIWSASDPRAAIRLQDLLRMRSGLRFVENYSNPSSDVLRMLFTCGDMAAYAATRPLVAPPGTVWSYSSGTTNILSAVVRRAVGDEAYLDWPRRALFDRIGMESAVLEPDASGTFVCSSFMLATARDWARYGMLWLQDGVWGSERILPEGWVRFSTSPTLESPSGNHGAHWWLKLNPELGGDTPDAKRLPADAFFALGHEGQTLTVIPSLRLVAVRLGLSIYIDAWNQAAFVASLADALKDDSRLEE